VQAGSARSFSEAQARHQCLAPYATLPSVLDAIGEQSDDSWHERERLTRALIAEYQVSSRPFWASVLLAAYYPMLNRLRHRVWGRSLQRDDLDQLVIASFLQVIATFPLAKKPDLIALRLRQRTERKVFDALRIEQRELKCRRELIALTLETQGTPFDEEPHLSEPDAAEAAVAMVIDIAGQRLPKLNLDLVVATFLKQEQLSAYADRVNGDHEPSARVYQRLKRRRAKVISRLRSLFRTRRRPRSNAEVLLNLRVPARGGRR